jgi:hypothetical protein
LPTSAVDAIGPAFQHTKQQLLHPFRVSQWAKLALVGMLAGELTSGGCSFNSSFPMPSRNPDGANRLLDMPALPHIDPAIYAGLIAFLVVFGLVFMVLFIYVSSVMRFVLFDSVIAKNCEIRKSWSRRHGVGMGYFVWQILVMLLTVAGMVIVIGVPLAIALALGWLKQPKEHMVVLILGGIALFFLFFAFMLVVAVVHVMSKDFVVPQMALENVSAIEGWRRLLPMLRAEKGSYVGYLAMKIVMTLGTAVVVGIVTAIVVLITLIPIGGLGAVAILLGKAGGLQWNLYTISLAVVAGLAAVGFILYVLSLVSVPATVFFPAYSIYYFAARYPALARVLYPAAPPLPAPPQAQFGPVG